MKNLYINKLTLTSCLQSSDIHNYYRIIVIISSLQCVLAENCNLPTIDTIYDCVYIQVNEMNHDQILKVKMESIICMHIPVRTQMVA